MRKILALLLFISAVSNAQAVEFTGFEKITQLHFWNGHTGVLIVHENMVNGDCEVSSQYILRKDHPFFREFYSLLLAAHIAGQPVKFGLSDCYEKRASIVHVYSNK